MSAAKVTVRSRSARAAYAVCAFAAALTIAGCGGGGGSASSSAGAAAPGAAAPSGGSATTSSAFDAQLADQGSSSAAASAGALVQQPSASAQPAASKPAAKPAASDPAATPGKPAASKPAAAPAKPSAPAQTAKPTTTPKPTVRTRTVTTVRQAPVRTVVHTVQHTVTQTVTTAVAPDVPGGAFMPSKQPALAEHSFTVSGNNVDCALSASGVRCEVVQRVWAPPSAPASCTGSWGNAIKLNATGPAAFTCGGGSAASADAQVLPDGYDDTIGRVTCQVRSFGVDCFSTSGHGFILSRTGYTFY